MRNAKERPEAIEENIPASLARQRTKFPNVYSSDGTFLGRDLAGPTEEFNLSRVITTGAIGGVIFNEALPNNPIGTLATFILSGNAEYQVTRILKGYIQIHRKKRQLLNREIKV